MSASGYRLLGYAVWHGGKWYLRRRLPLPSRRALALSGMAGCGAAAAAVLLARRPSS